jgi:hypothetical protein
MGAKRRPLERGAAKKSMRRASVLPIAAVLLAGCGQTSSQEAMNAKFQELDYKMANLEVGMVPSRGMLESLTREYISLIHEYADVLGAEEARRRLEAKETELSAYCLPCSAVVSEELAKR